jgi:membrane protein involved in colicin uptake
MLSRSNANLVLFFNTKENHMSKLLVVLLSGFISFSTFAADAAKPAADAKAAAEAKPAADTKTAPTAKADKKVAPAKVDEKAPAAK